MLGGYGLSLFTAPANEPLSLPEAKKQVEVAEDYTYHDEHLTRLIAQSRDTAERFCGRQIITATWDFYLDQFPSGSCPIYVPLPRLQSCVITYVDADGATQTWSSANYVVSTSREPGIVRPAYGQTYPIARYQPDAVKVRFVAGYGTTGASVPQGLRGAMLLLLAGAFEQRTDVLTGTIVNELPAVKNLLLQHRVGDEFTQYAENRPAYSVSA